LLGEFDRLSNSNSKYRIDNTDIDIDIDNDDELLDIYYEEDDDISMNDSYSDSFNSEYEYDQPYDNSREIDHDHEYDNDNDIDNDEEEYTSMGSESCFDSSTSFKNPYRDHYRVVFEGEFEDQASMEYILSALKGAFHTYHIITGWEKTSPVTGRRLVF
jgi:hypothetical protein